MTSNTAKSEPTSTVNSFHLKKKISGSVCGRLFRGNEIKPPHPPSAPQPCLQMCSSGLILPWDTEAKDTSSNYLPFTNATMLSSAVKVTNYPTIPCPGSFPVLKSNY